MGCIRHASGTVSPELIEIETDGDSVEGSERLKESSEDTCHIRKESSKDTCHIRK